MFLVVRVHNFKHEQITTSASPLQVHTGNYIRKTARATCTLKTNQAGKAMPRDTEGLNGTATKVTTKCAYNCSAQNASTSVDQPKQKTKQKTKLHRLR